MGNKNTIPKTTENKVKLTGSLIAKDKELQMEIEDTVGKNPIRYNVNIKQLQTEEEFWQEKAEEYENLIDEANVSFNDAGNITPKRQELIKKFEREKQKADENIKWKKINIENMNKREE